MNSTPCSSSVHHHNPLCFNTTSYPFYYSSNTQLVDGVPDHLLTLAAPVIGYWVLSLLFHCLDISEWKWLDKYRIHESAEVKSKNLVTKSQVVWAVIFQQLVQTALGLAVLSEQSSHLVEHQRQLQQIATFIGSALLTLLGHETHPCVVARVAELSYWWGIPCLQFLGAMYVWFALLIFLTNADDSGL